MKTKKSAEIRIQTHRWALLIVIGWLLGLLTTTLYWKEQARKEIEATLKGQMVRDSKGMVYVIKSRNK